MKDTEFSSGSIRMHSGFAYTQEGQLCFEGQEVASLAQRFGTPLYVYSADIIRERLNALHSALAGVPYMICYSAKANSNLSILRLIGQEGCGVDIVSGGELYRSRQASIPASRIVFSGTGKTAEELQTALQEGVLLFSVESEPELHLLASLAQKMGRVAQVSLRINPAVEADTHPYITTGRENDKFGIPSDQILEVYERNCRLAGVRICGLGFHIGSQIINIEAFTSAARVLKRLHEALVSQGFSLEYIDIGGGLGINYETERPPSAEDYVQACLRGFSLGKARLLLEPGRFIVGNAGILITEVLFTKNNAGKRFYIVDAAMNDLMRPSLYQAYHEVLPHRAGVALGPPADLVGPVCESGDFFVRDRKLPAFESGDYVVICSAGAYGFTMSSNYNSRRRAAEVLVENNSVRLIRRRESHADLIRLEKEGDYI